MMRRVLALLCFSGAAMAQEANPIFAKVSGSVVSIEVKDTSGNQIASGSGVVLEAQSVVTNCHVIVEGDVIEVKHAQRRHVARWTLRDPARDLCLLKVEGLVAKSVVLGVSTALAVGDVVHAVGNPLGFELSASSGHVAALPIGKDQSRMIVTSAQISPGSSGGGLFDRDGRLIGITTAVVGVAQSLNLAIPVEAITNLQRNGLPTTRPALPTAAEPKWMEELEALRAKRAWSDMEVLLRRYLALYPDGTYAMTQLGLALANQKKLVPAREILDKALALDPHNAIALSNRAAVFGDLGDLDSAERGIRQAISELPAESYNHLRLAKILALRGKYPEQLIAANRAVELYPTSAEAWVQVGAAQMRLNKSDDAIKAFRIALKLDPAEADARLNLTHLLTGRGEVDEARKELSAAPNPTSADPVIWLGVGEKSIEAKRMTDAEHAYRKAMVPGPYYARAAAGLAAVQLLTNRVDEAENLVEQTRKQYPDEVALMHIAARVHVARKRLDKAQELLEKIVPLPTAGKNAWRELAQVYMMRGNFPKAAQAFTQVVAREPGAAMDWGDLCTARLESGDPTGAEPACNKALALDANVERALLAMAKLHGQRGEHAKALEYYDRVLAINGGSPAAMSSKGYALMMSGRHADAVEVLETAVRLEPDFANAWINLGQAHLRQKQAGRAITALDRAVKLAPKAMDAHLYLAHALVATRQTKRAQEEIDLLKRSLPESPHVLHVAILAALTAGNREPALVDYKRLKILSAPMAAELYRLSRAPGVPEGMRLPE